MNKIDDKEKKNIVTKYDNQKHERKQGNRKSTRTETEEHQLKTKRISSKKRWR